MKISLSDISAGYSGKIILPEINLDVKEGEFFCLTGPNGSGKSTLLKCMARLLKPYKGTVSLDGRNMRSYSRIELASRIAVLPQKHHAQEGLSVYDFVFYGRFPHRPFFSLSPSHKDRQIVKEALERTGLSELTHRALATLSGGELQRAWIAMCLAQEPDVLLLDEPAAALDLRYQYEILEMLHSMNRKSGLTVVMVLHDLNHVLRFADRVAALDKGRIVQCGKALDVFTPDFIRSLYGIESRIVSHGDITSFVPLGTCAGHIKQQD